MDNKEITKNAYNSIANQYYEEYRNDVEDLGYIDKFLARCKFKVLDLACGMGHYSKYMHSKGFKVCGVDFSKGMLDIARETNPDIEFIESDICDLPKTLDKDFDGVLLAYVVQHMSKEETRKVLLNLHNYITDSCNLLIFYRDGEGIVKEREPFDESFEYTIKNYGEEEITELLNECGYDVTLIEEKPYVYDEYSVCPKTYVLFAQNKKL